MSSLDPAFEEQIKTRRSLLFGLVILTVLFLGTKWIYFMPSESRLIVKFLLAFLYIITTAWISLFFWSEIFGFFTLFKKKNQAGLIFPTKNDKINSKTAILMPIYNENTESVFSNLLAIADSVTATKENKGFDIFILSDSTNPNIWVNEENAWINAKKLMPSKINLYYRRRPNNIARKSGNIEDFCHKWGALYDYMIVLDADSLLSGECITQMVKLMQLNPQAGIIQVPPLVINSKSLFSRIQQFAGKVYGPIVSAGFCFWQGHDSNYWGHNAIIRTKAFIDCCKLPVLNGPKPFGGHILSHDFVEAALIRRGGWHAWLVPELFGSYEECPPTIIDYALRDRRWCQGNIQHLRILISKYLHPISRLHFTIGVMSYLSSLLLLIFLIVGCMVAFAHEYFPPDYFPPTQTLFPNWPIFDQIGTIVLFIISMFMLIFPKFLGAVIYIKHHTLKEIGGLKGVLKSVFAETLFSALNAPIMMLFQSKFICDILIGRDSGWKTQNRSGSTSWKEALNKHCWHTLIGIFITIGIYYHIKILFYWTLPITVGLMLSIPISVFSSREDIGLAALKRKWFIIPEEKNKPSVAKMAKRYLTILSKKTCSNGVLDIIKNNYFLEIHSMMLETNGPAPSIDSNVLKEAQIKLDNYINYNKFPEFTKEEQIALLYNADILHEANLEFLLK